MDEKNKNFAPLRLCVRLILLQYRFLMNDVYWQYNKLYQYVALVGPGAPK